MTAVRLEHALRMLGKESENLTTAALAPLGITTHEYDLLEAIDYYMKNPQRLALLASTASRNAYIGISRGSQIVMDLVRRGYVRRSEGGTRLLTAKGTQLLEDCRNALEPVSKHMHNYFAPGVFVAVEEAFHAQQAQRAKEEDPKK